VELSGKLLRARHEAFVGRSAERDLFFAALSGGDPLCHVIYVFGPGGVGKTSLVSEFAYACGEQGVPIARIDARYIEPSADSFTDALRSTLELGAEDSPILFFAGKHERFVLVIDTYELLVPLDRWLLESFLPQLPDNVLTVIAGREPPSAIWRTDPGWHSVVRVIALRNLPPDATRDLLAKRGVPAEQHDAVLEFTYGHPLAVALVTDVLAQRPGSRFHAGLERDVVRVLLGQLVAEVPGPTHRRALEACAIVSLTTEPLLAELLDLPDAHELFEWLCALSFIEPGPLGVFPHDVAREALNSELRWRDPTWYAEIHARARKLYLRRFTEARGHEQQRVLFEYVFLHRDNPVVKPYFAWQESGSATPEPARPEDRAGILDMVRRHEGEQSARLAASWLDSPSFTAIALRDAEGALAGFVGMVSLGDQPAGGLSASDPAVAASLRHLERAAPLRAGETATLFRYWMARDSYQAVSAVQSVVFIVAVRHYLATPGLAFTFFPCADPDFWLPVFGYADLERLPEADFTVGARRFGSFGHDWRVRPPLAWLELLGERETAQVVAGDPTVQTRPSLLVLSRPDFEQAVHQALRDYTQTDLLGSNPLLRSRAIVDRVSPEASIEERVGALQEVVLSATEPLKRAPREGKLFDALRVMYLEPTGSQERAAEVMDLPFSTFRRYLKDGVGRVTETLWQQEVGGRTG
jgi:hypothetical protein